jgi:putrescine importer
MALRKKKSLSVPATRLTEQVTEGRFRRVLGVPSLFLFGLVYMVPLTVFTTYGIVARLTGGRVVDAYIVTLVTMLFTARSYARMAAVYPYAGSAYVYTQQSFGGGIGFLAGWSLLLDYLFLPMINYLVIGLYLHEALPAVPQWVWIFASILVVTVLNIIGIISVARTNFVIIAAQIVFIVVFVFLAIRTGTGHETSLLAPFAGDGSVDGVGSIFNGAAILCLSFLGFDSVSTLSEEAKEPKRAVPIAIMLTTIVAGFIFIMISFLAQFAHPSSNFASVDTAATEVMLNIGGQWLSNLFLACYVAGALGSALTSQASVARILFAMGRDGVLPQRVLGVLSKRFGTPISATVLVSIVSLTALWISLDLISNLISFGALIAFSFVNLAVLKHDFIDGKQRSANKIVKSFVLPVIGFGLTIWLWTSLSGLTFIIGLSWIGAGVVILLIVTKGFTRPTPKLDMSE